MLEKYLKKKNSLIIESMTWIETMYGRQMKPEEQEFYDYLCKEDDHNIRELAILSGRVEELEEPNKYDRNINLKPNGLIDVYSVLRAFEPIDPAIQHAIKKLLAGGQRGHKDITKDYNEAIDSIKNYLENK